LATGTLSLTHEDRGVRIAYFGMVAAIIAWSISGIFTRFAQEEGLSSFLIAAGRLGLATLVLTPMVMQRHLPEFKRLSRNDWFLLIASGFWLGVHFVMVIAALEYTSVMIASVLNSVGPLWVVLLERLFFKTSTGRIVQGGVLCAVIGAALVALGNGSGMQVGVNPLLGSLLAIAGAGAGAVYMLVGRAARTRLTIIPCIWVIYAIGCVFCSLVMLVTKTQVTGHTLDGYFWLVLLTIFPQLIGHSALSFALGYLSPTWISVSSQVAIVVGAVLAFFVFHEQPGPLQLIGSAAILGGVMLASTAPRRKQDAEVMIESGLD
jgi:drug/metabolite transporter (DMT)-like permease